MLAHVTHGKHLLTRLAGDLTLHTRLRCRARGRSRRPDVDVRAVLELGTRALRHSATVPGAMQVTTGVGQKGEQHWVAGRAGRPYLRCGTRVSVVVEVANDRERRRTWWCPRCQPGPAP